MAFKHGTPNSIVTDGLVFCVDAANVLSYVSGSSNTFNLINSNESGSVHNDVDFLSSNAGCWDFDGIDDTIELESSLNSTVEAYTNSVSISCWFKPTNLSTRRGIIGNYVQAAGIGFYIDIIRVNDTTFKTQGGYHQTAAKYLLRQNNTNLSIYNWYNVTMTIASGGGSGNCNIYTNGVLDNGTEYRAAPDSSYSATVPTKIAFIAYAGDEIIGQISSTMIYNKVLSASEVAQNYNALKNRFRT